MIEVLLASLALAQSGGGAEELWERYPLEPSQPSTQQPAASAPTPAPAGDDGIVERDDGSDTFVLVALMALATVGGAAAVRVAQGAARRRHAPDEHVGSGRPASDAAGEAPPAMTARPPVATGSYAARRRWTAAPPETRSQRREPAKDQDFPARSAEPARAPRTRRFAPSEPAAEQIERCRVRLWSGHVSRCYVAQAPGAEMPIARSRSFRDASMPDASSALEGLVAELRAEGWEPVHDAHGEWQGWMRRRVETPARG